MREIRHRFDLPRWRDLNYVARKLSDLETAQIASVIAFFVLLATTFMTRSRAGSLLTIGVLGLVSVLYFSHAIRSSRHLLIGVALLTIFGGLAIDVVGGRFTNEIETRGTFDAGRAEAWLSALAIIRDHPWLGTGLGTFASVFPAYRAPAGGVWGVWDHAHSTPTELLVEMGIPFGMLVFGLWAAMLAILCKASLSRIDNRLYVVMSAGIGILSTLQSSVDFSLQIPGFSIVCCALIGAGLARALAPTEQLRDVSGGSNTLRSSEAKEGARGVNVGTPAAATNQNGD